MDILCLHEQGCEDPWLFFKAKRVLWTESEGNTDIKGKKGTNNSDDDMMPVQNF